MKLKHLLLGAAMSVFSVGQMMAANPNATVDQVKIYINPGHGTYTSSDRPMGTMKHGPAMSDTSGFYESNTNMQKAYGLLDKLKEYGVKYDPSKPITGTSQSNIRMSHATTGVSPELSTVATEAQTMNADVFISIHSNANTGTGDDPSGHTNFNQLLFLHRGWDGDPYVAGSYDMCMACWKHAISNKHMHWNWLSNPTVVYNDGVVYGGRKYYPSGKDADGNPYWIKGDVKFQYNTDRGNSSYTRYYGVLNHTIPGFLVEGYDHTYRPAMHRAMNDDVCRHEGELYARGLNDYFGWGKKDSYGKIYGIVRDQSITMNEKYYSIIQNPTLDANKYIDQVDNKKPLNNVKVTLYNSSGVAVDSYITDDEWNGAYMFKKVAPGTYTIKHSLSGYGEVTKEVTVTANETNYIDIDMRSSSMVRAVQGHYAYGLKLTKVDDKTFTASFNSTGDMSNGKIILTNSSTGEKTTIETGAVKKGANSVSIDATQLEDGVNYSWAVAFDNPQSDTYDLIYSNNSITHTGTYMARIGVAIDNEETSANFGTIYTITGYGQGVQKFNPDFSVNGSKFMTNRFGVSNISNSVRLETNGGKLYIANNDASSPGVWVYNPSGSTTPSQVISQKAAGVAFNGTGSSRKMYISGTNYAYGYNIGTADSWSGNASTTLSSMGALLLNGDGDAYAADNIVMASQIRYSPNNASGCPVFIITDPSGNIKLNSASLKTSATDGSSLEGCNGGGFAFSKDKSIFAIQEGATNNTSLEAPVKIYSVRWDGSNPTFIYHYTIPLSGTYAVDQMAFDHADNLYIASRQQGLLVYAIKTPSRQTVTNGSGTVVGAKPRHLYMVGNSDAIGNWDPYKAAEFTYNGQNYTITVDEKVEKFKISTNKAEASGVWTEFDAGNLTTNEAITNGGTISLIAQNGGDFILPWTGVWTITVSGDLSTLTATTTTPKPLNPLYIVGNTEELGAWNTENAVEVSNDRINYSITLDESVTEFKISTNKGDETTFNNGNLAVSRSIVNGSKINLIADAEGGKIALPWAGVWNITIAGDLSTLTATTSTPRPFGSLYIVGGSNAIGNWDPSKAVEIGNDGENYTITLNAPATEFKISTNRGGWSEFDAGNLTTKETITNGGTVSLIPEWGNNFVLPWEGEWNITISRDLSTLTASTTTPNPYEGPGIGPEPENAPNPDAIPGESEEAEDAQTEGYFAYDLQSSKSGDVYTFSFKSTGARKNGRIVLKNKSTGATIEIKTPIVKGQNNVPYNAYDIQKGDYTWSVKINNSANSTVTQVGNNNSIVYNDGTRYARIGVAIDNDQTSKYFGTIYTMTAFGKGLQKFNPDVTTNGSKILTGKFGQDPSSSTSNYRYVRSNRLEVNQGKVYIANYAMQNPGVHVYDPAGSETTTCVSGGAYYDRAIAFYGEGSSRKAFGSHATEHHVKRFDIGTATSWSSGSPNKYYKDDNVLQNGDGDILVTNNAVIVSQNRYAGNNQAQNPAFAVFDHDLNLKYKSDAINSTLNGSSNGGMAISTDYKTFAVIDGYNETTPGDLSVQVYSVSWNGSTPTFTYSYSFKLSGTRQVDQMEFDHAGNLLIASREKGLLKWAVKTSARATITNARSEFTISGLGRDAAPSDVVATRKCNGEGDNSAAGTVDAEITWKGEAGDYMISYRTMRRDESGNRVYDNNEGWVPVGTATIASGSTTGKFTHKNLAAGSDYNRIYNYKVANYYPAASYESTCKYMEISGKGRTVTSAAPTVPVEVTLTQPTVEVDGVTQYTFDLKLEIAIDKDVFNATLLDDNDEQVKATKYVVVVDEATAKWLNSASNVNEVGYFYRGPATMTANNCNHYNINDWYMVVDIDDVTPSGDLSKATKSITWKNVNPKIVYQPKVYTSAVRTFNFTETQTTLAGNSEGTLTLPSLQWIQPNEGGYSDVITLNGDYSSLVGNEDYPAGTFRMVGDTINATDPVSITRANTIGTRGAALAPLAVTDDVLGEYNATTKKREGGAWSVAYTFKLYKQNGSEWESIRFAQKYDQTVEEDLYSNTKNLMFDLVGMEVGCDVEEGPDGRSRFVYNPEKNPTYKLVIETNYRRTIKGEEIHIMVPSENVIAVNPTFATPEIDPYATPGYLFLETSTHWDENCKDEAGNYINSGYYKYYYDAGLDIHWDDFSNGMIHYMGFHTTPKFDCVGHYVKDEQGNWSNDWIPYTAASVMSDELVMKYNKIINEPSTPFEPLGYDIDGVEASKNWSATAASERHLPLKVHYVWAGNEKIGAVSDAPFGFELSANYPLVVSKYVEDGNSVIIPQFMINSYDQENGYNLVTPVTRGVSNGYDLMMITTVNEGYKSLQMDDVIETPMTGVEDVNYGEGALRLYPNPANSIVTLQAPITMTDVKIFTIDGQLVKEFDANDTHVKFDVSDLATGVYIVHAGGKTTRLVKR